MKHRKRLLSVLVAAFLTLTPAAAFGVTNTYTFNTADLPVPGVWKKLPTKSATRTNTQGTISMDVSTCPNPPAKWGGEFKREIKNFPDYRVVLADGQDYCLPAYVVKRKITKDHKYYFRVMNLRISDPPKATGTFKWTY